MNSTPSPRPFWLAGLSGAAEIEASISRQLAETLPRLASHAATNPTWLRRYRTGLMFLLPTIASGLGLSTLDQLRKLRVLEVGCGDGSKSTALAPFFGSYLGIDLSPRQIDSARAHARLLGTERLELRVTAVAQIDEILGDSDGFDVYVLYAVVEHLTIPERLHLLRSIWAQMKPGSLLVVAELPNRLCPVDHHSSELPYIDTLPDELALEYARKSPRPYFLDRVFGSENHIENLYRIGRGASHHEFELALGASLSSHIAVDGWDTDSLNQFPVRPYETLLHRTFQSYRSASQSAVHPVPDGFARYWMQFVFRKALKAPLPALHIVDLGAFSRSAGMANADMPVYRADRGILYPVAPGAEALSVGWVAASLKGDVVVEDGKGRRLFAARGQEIIDAAGGHWNPFVTTRFATHGADAVRIVCDNRDVRLAYLLAR